MIKLIGLNDDYHDTIFYDENGHSYHMNSLIWILAQPHEEIYDIRYLLYPNIDEDDENTQNDFDIVSYGIKSSEDEYKKAFNRLWNYFNTEGIEKVCLG